MSSGMLGAGCDGRGWGMHTCDELEGLGLGLLVGHGCCVSGLLRVGCGFNGRRSVGGDEVKLVWRWFDCAPAPGGACPISGSAFSRTTSELWWLDVFCDVWTLLQQRYPTNTTLHSTPDDAFPTRQDVQDYPGDGHAADAHDGYAAEPADVHEADCAYDEAGAGEYISLP